MSFEDASQQSNTSSKRSNKTKQGLGSIKGKVQYCDICQGSASFRNMALLHCRGCGINVHYECYGCPDRRKDHPNQGKGEAVLFVCWACAAVGKSVRVRERDPFTGQHIAITQKERSTECCLCSVQGEVHAMHPVYDGHGKRGRQIWLPPGEKKERRLAWAHTVCALTINANPNTAGTIYGCTLAGAYDVEEDAVDGDFDDCFSDSESINSDLDMDRISDGHCATDVHHFVYWGWAAGEEDDAWTRAIKNHKKDLRCFICGNDDDKTTKMPDGRFAFVSLRVPLQCCANNATEYEEFRSAHKGEEPCYQGLHVGCALWGRNDAGEQSLARRSWFFPGIVSSRDKRARNNVAEVYCDLHAKDIFCKLGSSANMERKLPGPFSAVQIQKRKPQPKHRQLKTLPPAKSPRKTSRSSSKVGTHVAPARLKKVSSTKAPTAVSHGKLKELSGKGSLLKDKKDKKQPARRSSQNVEPAATSRQSTIAVAPPAATSTSKKRSASEMAALTGAISDEAVALNTKRNSKLVRKAKKANNEKKLISTIGNNSDLEKSGKIMKTNSTSRKEHREDENGEMQSQSLHDSAHFVRNEDDEAPSFVASRELQETELNQCEMVTAGVSENSSKRSTRSVADVTNAAHTDNDHASAASMNDVLTGNESMIEESASGRGDLSHGKDSRNSKEPSMESKGPRKRIPTNEESIAEKRNPTNNLSAAAAIVVEEEESQKLLVSAEPSTEDEQRPPTDGENKEKKDPWAWMRIGPSDNGRMRPSFEWDTYEMISLEQHYEDVAKMEKP